MTHQVSVPAGIDPSKAVPADATVHQHSREGAPTPVAPPLPAATTQAPGFVPAPAAPAGADAAEFAAFQAWKASQAGTPTPAPVPAKPAAPARTSGFEDVGMGADAALSATKAAAQADDYLMATFSTFELVAPDIDLARAVGNAIDRGDVSLIDAAYLREKAGANADKLIKVAQGLVTHVTDTVSRLTTEIHTKAGGQERWDAAVQVFNTAAPKYLKEFVAQSIDSANPKRISTAVESLLDFVKNNGGLPTPPQGHVRAGGGAPDAALGLSKEAYQAERLKLDRRARDFPERERELTARRQLGKQMGL